jgi:LPS sulfotransferase NodH
MIAALPRTGSNQIAIKLWQTGAAGAPLEYLNLSLRAHDMLPRLGGGNVEQYWLGLEACRTSKNGVFSFKSFITDLRQVATDAPQLTPYIWSDQTIYLTRKDKIAQAVSWVRARQTSRWFSMGAERAEPSYCREDIASMLQHIKNYETMWEDLFQRTECFPFRVFYEDLIRDDNAIDDLLLKLSISKEKLVNVDIPEMSVQRDDLNRVWCERFRNEV